MAVSSPFPARGAYIRWSRSEGEGGTILGCPGSVSNDGAELRLIPIGKNRTRMSRRNENVFFFFSKLLFTIIIHWLLFKIYFYVSVFFSLSGDWKTRSSHIHVFRNVTCQKCLIPVTAVWSHSGNVLDDCLFCRMRLFLFNRIPSLSIRFSLLTLIGFVSMTIHFQMSKDLFASWPILKMNGS